MPLLCADRVLFALSFLLKSSAVISRNKPIITTVSPGAPEHVFHWNVTQCTCQPVGTSCHGKFSESDISEIVNSSHEKPRRLAEVIHEGLLQRFPEIQIFAAAGENRSFSFSDRFLDGPRLICNFHVTLTETQPSLTQTTGPGLEPGPVPNLSFYRGVVQNMSPCSSWLKLRSSGQETDHILKNNDSEDKEKQQQQELVRRTTT